MEKRILLTVLLLFSAGVLYTAEQQPQLSNLENLSGPTLDAFLQASPYEALINLRATSRTLRNKLAAPEYSNLLPTKLIEYWSQPLAFIGMNPKNSAAIELDKRTGYQSIAFAPHSPYIATSSAGLEFRLWKLEKSAQGKEISVQLIKALHFPEEGVVPGHPHPLSFSQDGKIIAGAVNNKIYLWEIPSGKLEGEVSVKDDVSMMMRMHFFSDNGPLLAYYSDAEGVVKLIDLTKRTTIWKIPCTGNFVFSPDHSMIACPIPNAKMTVWNVKDKVPQKIWEFGKDQAQDAIFSIAFSPDNATLALGLKNGRISLWNVKKQTHERTLKANKGSVADLSFSRYGVILAASYTVGYPEYHKITLWNVETGDQITSLDGKWPIAFSPDGLLLATLGDDGYMVLWQKAEEVEKATK